MYQNMAFQENVQINFLGGVPRPHFRWKGDTQPIYPNSLLACQLGALCSNLCIQFQCKQRTVSFSGKNPSVLLPSSATCATDNKMHAEYN